MTTTIKADRQVMPVDRMVGLIPAIPDDVMAAACRVIRSAGRDADPADVELVLQALGLEER